MTVIEEIAAERRRQIEIEGWTTAHDDDHDDAAMAFAAACYASPERIFVAEQLPGRANEPYTVYSDAWPWSDEWWKPKTRREDLIRAGALIVAEIERLDRAYRRLCTCSSHPPEMHEDYCPLRK